MESQKTKFISHPHRASERIPVKDLCPKCGSYFLSERTCEGCGYRLNYDVLGEPFGEKSLFILREDFHLEFFWLKRFIPSRGQQLLFRHSRGVRKYKRQLLHRFRALTDYFFLQIEENKERRKLFLFEAKEIIKELILFGEDKSRLYALIDQGQGHPFFPELEKLVREESQDFNSQDLSSLIRKKRMLWGQVLLFFVAFIFAAFWVAKFLMSK